MSAAFACLATSEQGPPSPADTDDVNDWATGLCMLYCRRDGVRVLWLGPVHVPGAKGEMYGCGQCIAELDYMIYQQSCRTRCREGCAEAANSSGSSGRWWRWSR